MELIKTSESYNITDVTEQWNVSGNVNKNKSGMIQINISVNAISGEYIGNFNYTINEQNSVNVNFDCGREYDDALFAYGNTLVDQITEQLSK